MDRRVVHNGLPSRSRHPDSDPVARAVVGRVVGVESQPRTRCFTARLAIVGWRDRCHIRRVSSTGEGGRRMASVQNAWVGWLGLPTAMGGTGSGTGVVVAIRPRHRAQGRCSCGWVGKPRLLLSHAKVDALIHAASDDCAPAIPLVQPETINALKPPAILTIECPAGCGASFPVPIVITDTPSVRSDDGERCIRFVAEAPELHGHIAKHLRTCPSARSWVDTVLHGVATARPQAG